MEIRQHGVLVGVATMIVFVLMSKSSSGRGFRNALLSSEEL